MPHEYNLNNLINFISSGIMTSNDVEDSTKEDLMKNLLKEVHDLNKIKEPNDKFPYFYTYVYEGKGKEKKRKKLFDKSKKKLLEKLVDFYALGTQKNPGNMTFKELYFEWVEYKREKRKKLSPSTIRRYETDYRTKLADSRIVKMKLCDLDEMLLEDLLIEIVEDNEMKLSSFKNIFSYFNMAFEYAYKKHYITHNYMDFVDKKVVEEYVSTTNKSSDKERILTIEQKELLLQSIWMHEKLYPLYMPDYAIELAFYTGMRVGELAALKWENIDDEFIHIRLSEHRHDYKDSPSQKVIGLPKNEKIREFPITEQIQEILGRIKSLNLSSPNGFVFVDENGKRYEASTISCASFRRGKEVGIKKTSIHRIRRTLSSELNVILDRALVANLLGHSERTNLQRYDYDTSTKEEKLRGLRLVNEKFSKFSNLYDFYGKKEIAKAL